MASQHRPTTDPGINPVCAKELEGLPGIIEDVKAPPCSCFKAKDSEIYLNAVNANHIDCFKTAFKFKTPWSKHVKRQLRRRRRLRIFSFCEQKRVSLG